MVARSNFIYKINITSASDVFEFVKSAVNLPYDVTLVNGKHRLNAKSYLSVILAKMSWGEIFIESDFDCYFDLEKFIE